MMPWQVLWLYEGKVEEPSHTHLPPLIQHKDLSHHVLPTLTCFALKAHCSAVIQTFIHKGATLLACVVTTLLPYPISPPSAGRTLESDQHQGEYFEVCQMVTPLRTYLLSMHTFCKGQCRLPSCNAIIFVQINLYSMRKPFIHYTCIVHGVCCIHRFKSAPTTSQ